MQSRVSKFQTKIELARHGYPYYIDQGELKTDSAANSIESYDPISGISHINFSLGFRFFVRVPRPTDEKRELLRNFKNGVYDFIHSHG